MAEDGMVLNLEIPTGIFAPKPSFKGRWKDRLTARKSVEWGQKKTNERLHSFSRPTQQVEELNIPREPPAKRQRTEDVVSSLFTYNPTSSTKPESRPEVEDNAQVEPSNAPLTDTFSTFTSLGLSPVLANHLLRKLDIKAPTAVQRQALQHLCAHDTDAFIQAETGSGKTLAYLLPVVQKLLNLSTQMKDAGESFGREGGVFALILAPTRELSKQISAVLESLLSSCHWIVCGTVIGGEKKKSEKARLRKGVNVLVATPGRLVDHLDHTEVLNVRKVRWLILDEGDRLMELGFENDIQKIVSILNLRAREKDPKPTPGLPQRRTTILCSATIKSDVDQLRSIALKDPVDISISQEDDVNSWGKSKSQEFSAPAQLKQSYALVPPKQRLVTLAALLKQTFKRKGSVMKAIVFMSCADSVDFHFEIFAAKHAAEKSGSEETAAPSTTATKANKIPQGHSISEARTQSRAAFSNTNEPVQIFRLHGSLQQSTRTAALKAFAQCIEPAVLICTDVASRGLDLPNIDLVIEYDPPFSKDDHLHRVGRTARAGNDGRAMVFLMPGCEEGYIDILKEGRPRNLIRHDAEEILKKAFSASTKEASGQQWGAVATDWQLEVERRTLENPTNLEQARRAYQSHVRAYATHVAAERSIFDMKQLHLGHLAKAFGLRDKPGSMRVPGLRPGKDVSRKDQALRKADAARGSKEQSAKRPRQDDDVDAAVADEREARRKMHAKMRAMGGASEFNLG